MTGNGGRGGHMDSVNELEWLEGGQDDKYVPLVQIPGRFQAGRTSSSRLLLRERGGEKARRTVRRLVPWLLKGDQ